MVHCIEGSHGHKIFGETAKQVQIGDMIIDKPSFGSMELAKAAMENNYEKIELVGLVVEHMRAHQRGGTENRAAEAESNCGCGLYRELRPQSQHRSA